MPFALTVLLLFGDPIISRSKLQLLLEDLKVSSSLLAPEIQALYLLPGISQVKIGIEIQSAPPLLKTHQWFLIALRTDKPNVATSFLILCLSLQIFF